MFRLTIAVRPVAGTTTFLRGVVAAVRMSETLYK
jgi:hypothetical protein